MRVFLIALCACGGAAASQPSTAVTPVPRKPRVEPHAPVDVITALAQEATETSWIVPGPAQLVLGGATVQANEGAPRLEVSIVEEQGSDLRIGVRLDHARFALWMSRSRLLAIVARDQRVMHTGAPVAAGRDPMQVVLHRGAQVQRLARKDGRTQVRYVGALEVEGWLPDDSIADRAPPGAKRGSRVHTGKKPLMLMQGAVIRAEPKWTGEQIAVMNHGYFVDLIAQLDDTWSEISYEDSDLSVHGYVSRRDPPGRTHRARPHEALPAVTPNATVRDLTCLHIGGEPVGFIVGKRAVLVEKTGRAGWFALTIDTPWGPIAFEARGATETELVTCGG